MNPGISGFFTQIIEWVKGLRLWFLVYPWQAAIRVRLGNRVKDFGPGVHFKIPWIDRVFIQGTRTCSVLLPLQSLTTTDKKIANVMAVVNYRLIDLRAVYETTYRVSDWIISNAMSAVAGYVSHRTGDETMADGIGTAIRDQLIGASERGIEIEDISIVAFSVCKAYRLIGESPAGAWFPNAHGEMTAPNDHFGGGNG